MARHASLIRPLVFALIALLAGAGPAHSVALTLGSGETGGAMLRSDATGALYASDIRGKPVLITEVNAEAPGGGVITELGVPSITPDGRVLFGAEVTAIDGDSHFWEVFVGDPNAAFDSRVRRALRRESYAKGCAPEFRGDAYPVGDEKGAIAFMAPEASGHDALFLYSGGKLACIARAGESTVQGHVIAVLGFGTAQMGNSGEVVINGWLTGDRQAVMIASLAGGIRELAVEGELGPNRTRYMHPFGLPAALPSAEGTMVAFTSKTSSGSALFLYRDGKMARILPTGTATSIGPVTYLSPGRPGLMADGTTAVLAGCARMPAIFRLDRGHVRLTLRRGRPTPFGAELVSLGDPALTASGIMFVGAIDSNGEEKVYELGDDDLLFEAGTPPIFNIAYDDAPPAHSIFSGTLAVNQRGDFTYLGGK